MRMNDLLAGAPADAQRLADDHDPLRRPRLLRGAQLTRIVDDVLSGTVGVLFELRQAPRLTGNTALLRVAGVSRQQWTRTAQADEFTAWSLTEATIHQSAEEFRFLARFSPAGALQLAGDSAELILLDALPAPLPVGGPQDLRQLLRFGIADETSECAPLAVARSRPTPGW